MIVDEESEKRVASRAKVVVKSKNKKRLVPTTWLAKSKFYNPETDKRTSPPPCDPSSISDHFDKEFGDLLFGLDKSRSDSRSIAPRSFRHEDNGGQTWDLESLGYLPDDTSVDSGNNALNMEAAVVDVSTISHFRQIYFYRLYFDSDDTVDSNVYFEKDDNSSLGSSSSYSKTDLSEDHENNNESEPKIEHAPIVEEMEDTEQDEEVLS